MNLSRPFLGGHHFSKEGIPIPGEEKSLIRKAEHPRIPRARNGYGWAAGWGSAGGQAKASAPEQGGAARDLQRVFNFLAHASPCLLVSENLRLCLTKAPPGVEAPVRPSPACPFSLDPQALGR
jgi:hypothetical protein